MERRPSKRPQWFREKARATVVRLLEMAKAAGDSVLSLRYSTLAKKVAMRYNVKLPKESRICKRCGGLLMPGRTAKVRLSGHIIKYICESCGTVRKIGYSREKA